MFYEANSIRRTWVVKDLDGCSRQGTIAFFQHKGFRSGIDVQSITRIVFWGVVTNVYSLHRVGQLIPFVPRVEFLSFRLNNSKGLVCGWITLLCGHPFHICRTSEELNFEIADYSIPVRP